MNDTDPKVSVNTGSFTSLLQVLFIGLKLTGFISWSWWWVLSPTWMSAIIVFAALAFFLVVKGWASRR